MESVGLQNQIIIFNYDYLNLEIKHMQIRTTCNTFYWNV